MLNLLQDAVAQGRFTGLINGSHQALIEIDGIIFGPGTRHKQKQGALVWPLGAVASLKRDLEGRFTGFVYRENAEGIPRGVGCKTQQGLAAGFGHIRFAVMEQGHQKGDRGGMGLADQLGLAHFQSGQQAQLNWLAGDEVTLLEDLPKRGDRFSRQMAQRASIESCSWRKGRLRLACAAMAGSLSLRPAARKGTHSGWAWIRFGLVPGF